MACALAFFARHPVFRFEEFRSYHELHGTGNERTIKNLLSYHVRKGHIARLSRSLYAVIPRRRSRDADLSPDPYLIGGCLTEDAVISHRSAMELHGWIFRLDDRIHLTTRRHNFTRRILDNRYIASGLAAGWMRSDDPWLGVVTRHHRGRSIRVTGPERTLVDALANPQMGFRWDLVFLTFHPDDGFDVDLAIRCALATGKRVVAAKLGLLISRNSVRRRVSDQQLRTLAMASPKFGQYIDRNVGMSRKQFPPWNLIVPLPYLELPGTRYYCIKKLEEVFCRSRHWPGLELSRQRGAHREPEGWTLLIDPMARPPF